MAQTHTSHVVLLPSPGMGHLIPLAEFAKRLVNHHNLSVTLLVPLNAPPTTPQKSVLDSLPAAVTSVFLPPVDLSDLPDGTRGDAKIAITVIRSFPAIRQHLKAILATSKIAALVVDLFATDAFDVAGEFKISPYIFYPSTAMCLSLFLHLPDLDETVSGEYRDLPDPIRLPGCVPIPGRDLLDPLQDRKNDSYKWTLHHCKRYRLAEGILENSFMEMETGALKALQQKSPGQPPVYAVGPLVKVEPDTNSSDPSGCLEWLDNQPPGSVVYVSFGSGGTLSWKQQNELAYGLEASGQRFIWVVKIPNDESASAAYFDLEQAAKDPLDLLPEGFRERTRGRGLVVASWAPQVRVLSHGSTGGFLTHCGWNSTLESVVNGVPLIAWPLYAEQRMNAVMLTEDVKVALRPKAGGDGVIVRDEIARVVKELMEGEEGKRVTNRMKDLKEAAAAAFSHGGSSAESLSELVSKWKNQSQNTKTNTVNDVK